MSENPSIIKLCQQSTNNNLYKRKVVNSLYKNNKIVHFIKILIPNKNTMHSDYNNSHYLTNYWQPCFHEFRVRILCSWPIDKIWWEVALDWTKLSDWGGEVCNDDVLISRWWYLKESIVLDGDCFLYILSRDWKWILWLNRKWRSILFYTYCNISSRRYFIFKHKVSHFSTIRLYINSWIQSNHIINFRINDWFTIKNVIFNLRKRIC